jgi:hypothetical protein
LFFCGGGGYSTIHLMIPNKIIEIQDLNSVFPNTEKKFWELSRGASSYAQEIRVQNTSPVRYDRNIETIHMGAYLRKQKRKGHLKFRILNTIDCCMDNLQLNLFFFRLMQFKIFVDDDWIDSFTWKLLTYVVSGISKIQATYFPCFVRQFSLIFYYYFLVLDPFTNTLWYGLN